MVEHESLINDYRMVAIGWGSSDNIKLLMANLHLQRPCLLRTDLRLAQVFGIL